MPLKVINVIGGQAWYYQQIFQLADSKPLKLKLGVLGHSRIISWMKSARPCA